MTKSPSGMRNLEKREEWLKNYDYSPLHYCLMHAMVQPALKTEWASEAGVRRIYPSPQWLAGQPFQIFCKKSISWP